VKVPLLVAVLIEFRFFVSHISSIYSKLTILIFHWILSSVTTTRLTSVMHETTFYYKLNALEGFFYQFSLEMIQLLIKIHGLNRKDYKKKYNKGPRCVTGFRHRKVKDHYFILSRKATVILFQLAVYIVLIHMIFLSLVHELLNCAQN